MFQLLNELKEANPWSIAFAVGCFFLARWFTKRWESQEAKPKPGAKLTLVSRGRMPLEAHVELDYTTIEPRTFDLFKEKYAVTMGLMKTTFQEWLLLDKNYKSEVLLRKNIANENPESCNLVQDSQEVRDAIGEAYDMILGYMKTKYPQYFQEQGKSLVNLITGEAIPKIGGKTKMGSRELLYHLNGLTSEDFLFLEYNDELEEYVLKAATFIAPNGFDPNSKIGLKLTDIHGPVPLYEEKLKLSMNRYFHKIDVGLLVQRLTWTVQNHAEIFTPTGTHAKKNEKVKPIKPSEFDPKEMHLRTERQQLSRLPKSRFLLFTVKTYLESLESVKARGEGPQMAAAIKAMAESKEMAQYKRVKAWGPVVGEYMLA